MRVADSLEIPDDLERARAAGELVVFAGAGVSMGAPANLPSFVRLAREIAVPKVPWKPTYAKSLDMYLGRAERENVDVQARARGILNVGGAHTSLHEDLLGLFGTADRVRLITTNFDTHFSSAAAQVFPGERMPEYVGPALPPGQDFRGIAQLHGSLNRPESRLVLTDGDFATAYMAEGWAARFLARVFADRAVLFVGYSLSDPIMRYLLHALPPTGRWFALWHRSAAGQGAEHRIHPVTFGKARARDRYRDLNDGLKRWRWYATARAVDHDRELRRLVALGPPSSPLDADYLRARLLTNEGREVFWETARGDNWFDWVASEGLLDGLVDPRGRDPYAAAWGRWCLNYFCDGEVPTFLRHLRGRSLTLDPTFRGEVVRFLWRRQPLPPRPVLRQLLTLVVGGGSGTTQAAEWWEWLIQRLISEGLHDEALILLNAATQLELQPLERAYTVVEDSTPATLPAIATRVATRVPPSRLAHVLEEQGITLAEGRPRELLSLGERRIEEAYQLLDLARGADDGADWFSFGRTAVAPSNQDSSAHAEDVFVDIVRLALERLGEEAPGEMRQFATRYESSQRALLRRLALYAFSVCKTCSSDDVLARATTLQWARDPWVRPEFYRVLAAHFGRSSEDSRAALVAALRDDTWWGGQLDNGDAHARFSLSVKLLREAPDSPAAMAFATEEREAHPTWEESDRDGFLSRIEIGWGNDEPSPLEADQLAALQPERLLDEVRAALGDAEDRAGALFGALQQAARANPSWAVALFAPSIEDDVLAVRVAESVLYGLREADVPHDDRMSVLAHAAAGQWQISLARPLAALLDRWGDTLGKAEPPAMLDALDAAADAIYERSAELSPAVEVDGWTERAINHPAGQAAQIWWQVANARDWVGGQFAVTLDAAEKERWGRVIADPSPAGAFARPVLGMATDRLAVGDYPWAVHAIYPAFDPAAGAERAAQLWDGRLMQGQWLWNTVEGLRPYFSSMFRRAAELLPARANELGDLVALFAADPERSGLTLSQLQTFVQHASEAARVTFADAMPSKLERLDSSARERVWRSLLQRYWADRRTRMPVALAAAELRGMARWVLALPEVADDVVAALRASPMVRMEQADGLIWDLSEDQDWVRGHPAAAAGLVAFFGERQSIPVWFADHAVSVLEVALGGGAPPAIVREAGELLVALPSPRAAELLDRL